MPQENLAGGLLEAYIPELGPATRGKVRDIWTVDGDNQTRVMVTTDRLSAFDRIICTIPGKGKILNLLSAFWFDQTRNIIPNHVIGIPHPNVVFARQAQSLPVEFVVRGYMARATTTTSVFYKYETLGKREIYGINFPDGMKPNQVLPMGPILTPTTKADTGHDEEITDEQAQEMVDSKFGDGVWEKAKAASFGLYERMRKVALSRGLIPADTKFEFGIDREGNLLLIDEIGTPDSSRWWLAETYEERLKNGEDPENYDKELIRKWLKSVGFTGDGPVPGIPKDMIDRVARAYAIPYRMLTGLELPDYPPSGPKAISDAVLRYLSK
ncbi:MAG: hypothetical protein A3G66_00285 [Candidatus Levybacteria bacterium RIFCSPLOWO2_12_FULL_39_17]|nr:MAG: hypothetical protein A3H82_02105 [Candidatus Levybacteria bacterium RIFCSPLOWO2_02_FULL_39_26]OGH47623.1 MAG: hypothetical protein A3G66_00285 [Candidatus Levybacteria bacterium RIFCSPLOWO2_12_FULL_39_17]